MKVTRITLDSELGLVELHTGPGGDGNYVLLPIDIPPTAAMYLRHPGEATVAEAPEESGSIVAAGGWSVPKDQAYDYNTTPGLGAYDAEIADPPRFERGGIKYPARKTEEKELNAYLAADECETISVTNNAGETVSTEKCDGHCGAHPVDGSIEFPGTATIEEVAEALKLDTKIVAAGLTLDSNGLHPTVKPEWQEPETGPGRGERDGGFWAKDTPNRERHTGPATCPDPVTVFATDYGHGYRLTCPALPQWTRTINRYDLHRVPGLIGNALGEKKTVSVTIIEEQ
jgi:hypothetical protein